MIFTSDPIRITDLWWGQTTWNLKYLSPKRDRSSQNGIPGIHFYSCECNFYFPSFYLSVVRLTSCEFMPSAAECLVPCVYVLSVRARPADRCDRSPLCSACVSVLRVCVWCVYTARSPEHLYFVGRSRTQQEQAAPTAEQQLQFLAPYLTPFLPTNLPRSRHSLYPFALSAVSPLFVDSSYLPTYSCSTWVGVPCVWTIHS